MSSLYGLVGEASDENPLQLLRLPWAWELPSVSRKQILIPRFKSWHADAFRFSGAAATVAVTVAVPVMAVVTVAAAAAALRFLSLLEQPLALSYLLLLLCSLSSK